MTFILGLLAVIAVFSSLLLMFVILLQEPKGGGIASALGGSGMEALGVATGGVNRFTCWVAGVWVFACLLHAILQPVGANLRDELVPPKTDAEKADPGSIEKKPDEKDEKK
jgi:protein translocase SecG subunit